MSKFYLYYPTYIKAIIKAKLRATEKRVVENSYTYYYSKYTRPPTPSSSSPSKYKRDNTTSPPIILYRYGYYYYSSSLNFVNAFVTRSPSTIKSALALDSFNNNKVKEEGGEEDKK
ncbi:hypothetical protein EJ08DRAFT_666905 [Tothia fuscella]|uniref:Uncharacterized protein n=1 Tax=Tothia fuscella TaxID=1048955 RepID=A0A9P4NDD7_9PEZI|nr:hypothetical protein EJ08DRAFT_666905 [Tothia fuscella]